MRTVSTDALKTLTRAKAPACPAPYPHLQSRRDCVTQPRVARNELPWVKRPMIHNPNGVAAWFYFRGRRPQPFQGCLRWRPFSQGSSFLASLGFIAESLWDSPLSVTHSNMSVRSRPLD